ncbi:unnamed protein product [Periconia digitata]|uniref:Uncharacterized protein n=1 Tax=Periconia digitata TaxID=1303443 RepID=A0A9W4UCF0_9PLEO|nr:unnamed protein product [Periconia digitata]
MLESHSTVLPTSREEAFENKYSMRILCADIESLVALALKRTSSFALAQRSVVELARRSGDFATIVGRSVPSTLLSQKTAWKNLT